MVMDDEARLDAGTAAYRGFLFADMRGFTAFAERHGNAAAAAMVARFLEIARTAIPRHHGAELKTEGDAIHAVFPSASSAVLCGLEIVDAAAELNAQEPGRPLGLGVGVHAGEAVETAEGYIGRAVNIAARLCAAARPGEVLVSSTVKGITQASIPVVFNPRGRRRLKGIQDPIVVYAVTRDTGAAARRAMPSPMVLGAAGIGAAALVVIVALLGSRLLGSPGGSPGASGGSGVTAAPVGERVQIGPLAIGTWRSVEFEPRVTFNIVDPGWSANRDTDEMLGVVRDEPPRGSVYFVRVQEVIRDPCIEGGEAIETPPSAADLVATLEGMTTHLTLTGEQTVRVGGYTGQQVDIAVSDGALAACGGLVGGDVALFDVGQEVWGAASGERFRLISLSVEGQAVTILLSTEWSQTFSTQELDSLLRAAAPILDSVRF
jgi:class 3 adenylate cyclase